MQNRKNPRTGKNPIPIMNSFAAVAILYPLKYTLPDNPRGNMKYILFICMFFTAACAPSTENHSAIPTKFNADIGGVFGPRIHVTLKNGLLYYSANASSEKPTRIHVSEESWDDFRTELDTAKIWRWKNRYLGNDLPDGTNWSISIAYPDKRMNARGYNGFPTKTSFDKFIKAVETLTQKPFR